jgi:[acyl-carrier-protein] S-malonyltransferase
VSTALLFPGQGAQKIGMGVDVADAWPAAAAVFETAADALGLDLLGICREGPAELLVRTDLQQPAILAAGAAVHAALVASGALAEGEVTAAFGLSLGEFTALHAAGALKLQDALVLVRERGIGMQEASDAQPSGMTALRCEHDDAIAICADAVARTGGVCLLANRNAPGQAVISGDVPSLEAAEEIAAERGVRRPMRLPVSGAFHSPLMQIGADRLAQTLESIDIAAPKVPVYSNVTGEATSDPAVIRENLVAQVTSPVLFMDCVKNAVAAGVTRVVETAPGRVLTGLVRRIDGDVACVNVDTAAALADLIGTGDPS